MPNQASTLPLWQETEPTAGSRRIRRGTNLEDKASSSAILGLWLHSGRPAHHQEIGTAGTDVRSLSPGGLTDSWGPVLQGLADSTRLQYDHTSRIQCALGLWTGQGTHQGAGRVQWEWMEEPRRTIRSRLDAYAKSEWFRRAYHDRSLGDSIPIEP